MQKSRETAERDLLVPLNRRNYLLAIANGVLFIPGNRLADIATVLPLLLLRLSGRQWLVGMAHALLMIAPVIPDVFASRLVDSLERKRPVFIWCALVRFLSTVGMGVSVVFAARIGYGAALVLLLSCFTLRVFAQGPGNQAFTHIVANSVPTTRRGSLWMYRQSIGLILVMIISRPLVEYMLSDRTPFEFPVNYGVLILLSALLMGVSWGVFSFVSEPEARSSGHRLSLSQHLARGRRLLSRDADYRRLVRLRLLLSAAGAITPFFIAFAVEVWGFDDSVAATFLATQVVAQMVGCQIAGRISDRLGNRLLLLFAAVSILATAAVVVAGSMFTPEGGTVIMGWAVSWRLLVMMACFSGAGIFMAALQPAYINFMMDIAPRRKLPSYVGFASAFLCPTALAPLGYGLLIESVGYQVIFQISLLLGVTSLILAFRIGEPRNELDEHALDHD